MEIRKCLAKGCQVFLACAVVMAQKKLEPNDVDVGREFDDVFPNDVSGLPPSYQLNFKLILFPVLFRLLKHHIN